MQRVQYLLEYNICICTVYHGDTHTYCFDIGWCICVVLIPYTLEQIHHCIVMLYSLSILGVIG